MGCIELGIFIFISHHKYLLGDNLITKDWFDPRQPTLPSTYRVWRQNISFARLGAEQMGPEFGHQQEPAQSASFS